jgi:hypothetical protein
LSSKVCTFALGAYFCRSATPVLAAWVATFLPARSSTELMSLLVDLTRIADFDS